MRTSVRPSRTFTDYVAVLLDVLLDPLPRRRGDQMEQIERRERSDDDDIHLDHHQRTASETSVSCFAYSSRIKVLIAPGLHRCRTRPQQREAPTLAVHRVLPRRERHVPPGARSTLPNRKPDQLQALELACGEMELHICEFPGGLPLSFGMILTVILSSLRYARSAVGVQEACRRKRDQFAACRRKDVLECDQRVIGFWDGVRVTPDPSSG